MQPAHVVKGSEVLVIGQDGPLSSLEASKLFGDSAANAYSPGYPPPSSSKSLASVLLPRLGSDSLKALARTTEIGAGVKLEELSAKYWGFGKGFAGTDGFPTGGYRSIVDELVKDVETAGTEIKLGSEVVSIEDLGKDRGVKVTTRNESVYEAKAVISTIPLGVLQALPLDFFRPALPPATIAAIGRTRVGVLEKAVLSYSSAWWTEPSKYGTFLLLPVDSSDSKPTSLGELFSKTTLSVTSFARVAAQPHSTLLIYLGASAGSFIADYAASEVVAALHEYLVSRIPLIQGSKQGTLETPLANSSTVTSWLNDAFSRGATSSPVVVPGGGGNNSDVEQGEIPSPLDFVTLSRAQWDGRLGFSGEHTDLDNRGSAAGAVISGQREGERVKGLLQRW